ncbi:MAG: hypothetical protein PHN72_01105 [Bacilli bacterium]|nr:hypothetical protein [Bacilli bacterium]
MKKYNEVLEKYHLKPKKIEYKGKAVIVYTDEGNYVIKEIGREDKNEIFEYLKSRNFSYYPEATLERDADYEIVPYIEGSHIPEDQKMFDLVDLLSLLHSKTTHYSEVTEDDYKEIYEDVKGNIEHLRTYYTDQITLVETKIFMSPSEYLLALNITKILSALYYAEAEIESWYEMIKEKRTMRRVVLHNNLSLDHFIRNEKSYFINWKKSKIDIPIFDFYKLYKRHGLDFDFYELLAYYEKKYPLQDEERKLLFILMALPDKLEERESEYARCKMISEKIDFLYKTEFIISPYNTEKGKENDAHEEK